MLTLYGKLLGLPSNISVGASKNITVAGYFAEGQ
jgi:hypothetical protein